MAQQYNIVNLLPADYYRTVMDSSRSNVRPVPFPHTLLLREEGAQIPFAVNEVCRDRAGENTN